MPAPYGDRCCHCSPTGVLSSEKAASRHACCSCNGACTTCWCRVRVSHKRLHARGAAWPHRCRRCSIVNLCRGRCPGGYGVMPDLQKTVPLWSEELLQLTYACSTPRLSLAPLLPALGAWPWLKRSRMHRCPKFFYTYERASGTMHDSRARFQYVYPTPAAITA